MPSQLDIKKIQIASAGNRDQFLDLLSLLSDEAANINIGLGKNITDTIDTRRAIATFLTNAVDEINRISNNTDNTSSVGEE